MISLNSVLQAALLITLLLCLQLLRRAGSGRETATIVRRSQADAETSWANLRDAWDRTGLTFMAADIRDSDEDGTRSILPRAGGRNAPIVFRRLPTADPHAIRIALVSDNRIDYPLGRQHFEEWSVEQDGAGSRIVVRTAFVKSPLKTLRTLWALRHQAGILASPQAGDVIAALAAETSADASLTPRSAPASRTQSVPAPRLPVQYGREAVFSLLAFAYLLTQFTWQAAVTLSLVILWHEYGHLLAYRLTGKTGNRLMLVPFFGGIAVAGSPHKSEFEKAFCALMGPGFSVPLTLASFALWYYDLAPDYDEWFWLFIRFSAILNLLNLLPIFPLDGGQTAEGFLRSFLPGSILVHLSGLSVAGLVALAGLGYYEMAVFVGIYCLMNIRTLPTHSALPPMTIAQAATIALLYAAVVAVHGGVFYYISA